CSRNELRLNPGGSSTDSGQRQMSATGRPTQSPGPIAIRAARFGLIDRTHSARLPRVSFKRHFGALMTHAVRAEGATPDWRSPPYVGSGPFAVAVPCARVPGRYAEPRNVKNRVAHPWSWALGSTTKRGLEVV